MKKIIVLIFILILMNGCTPSMDTNVVDQTLDASSKSLGNVDLVNDITNQNQTSEKKDEANTDDLQLNFKDQRSVEVNMNQKNSNTNSTYKPVTNSIDRDTTTLQVQEKVPGTGVEATSGRQVSVHYIGKLVNGTEFDNSYKRGQPITFTLGEGDVIKGWDIAIEGMKVGGKRHLVIPPQLAYGDSSPNPQTIPNGATLIFDVELVDVK